METFTKEALEKILEEIVEYQVPLEEDPTLPQLGTKYLQRVLAQCRNYMNRVQYYMQQTMRYEKNLRMEIKMTELDLEFKVKEKLADDAIVRQQRAIDDRRALAETQLKPEFENLAQLRVRLIDVEETVKLIKSKYADLKQTNQDIKTQRNLVRDDKEAWGKGEEGYNRPQVGQDRSIPGGLPAPVKPEPVSPADILDPTKRPEDLPEPLNEAHAELMSEWLARNPEKPQVINIQASATLVTRAGTICSVCKEPQYVSESGPVCKNGHGGAPSEPEPTINAGIDYSDLLSE